MLFVLREIFEKLNNESIRYIHWKSNEHLEAALKGCTDLDIMVHPDDQKRFVEIIQDKGFSLYQSVGKQSYISISDYLFLDTESRKIVHIHLHNRLMVGRKFFKEYLIPVEELYFNKAVFDDNYPVKIMDPTQELVTLWIRYALKTSILKYVLSKFTDEEYNDIIKGITDAGDAVSMIIKNGNAQKAMNTYNKKGIGN